MLEFPESENPYRFFGRGTPRLFGIGFPSETYETIREASIWEESAGIKRSIVVLVMIVAAAAAVLFAAGALVTWMYLSGLGSADLNNSQGVAPSPSQRNPNGSPSPVLSRTPSSKNSPSPSATPDPIERERAEQEVSNTIGSWRTQTEELDLNSYMENYAAKVDYYNRKGVDRSYVRADKARAFGMYRSITMELENIKVTVDDTGDLATAVFDKKWEFRGDRDSSGRVRSELRLHREGGRWLIVGERDLKVYYVNCTVFKIPWTISSGSKPVTTIGILNCSTSGGYS